MNEKNVMTSNKTDQVEKMPFIRIPKAILTDEKYAQLSQGAMLLYGILLDRRSLSERNDWKDKSGDVFVYCTLETIQVMLKCAHQKAAKLLTELEQAGLIRRKIQGLGRPAKIYVVDISALSAG